jgi:hypothetical protein
VYNWSRTRLEWCDNSKSVVHNLCTPIGRSRFNVLHFPNAINSFVNPHIDCNLSGPDQGGITMLPVSSFNRTLSEVAPILSRRFFTCSSRSNCGLRSEVQATYKIQGPAQAAKKSGLRIRQLNTDRSSSTNPEYTWRSASNPATLLRSSQTTKTKWIRAFSASTRSRAAAATEATGDAAKNEAGKGSSFPRTSTNTVAYWLLGSAASVFGIVVFGGLTRLTESG